VTSASHALHGSRSSVHLVAADGPRQQGLAGPGLSRDALSRTRTVRYRPPWDSGSPHGTPRECG
jgi:hypothetical protein